MGKIKKEECEAIYISKHHHSKLRKVMEDYYSSYKTSRLKIINSTEFIDVLDHMGNLYIEGCIDKMYSEWETKSKLDKFIESKIYEDLS